MDDNCAVILGALIGGGTTLAGSWFTYFLQTKRSETLAEKRRKRLKQLLSGDKFTWRSIETLSAAIGADESTTCELLIEIDARASLSNNRSWALVSRAPWPEDIQPKN